MKLGSGTARVHTGRYVGRNGVSNDGHDNGRLVGIGKSGATIKLYSSMHSRYGYVHVLVIEITHDKNSK